VSLRSVIIAEDDKNEIKRYLLGQSDEADEEQLELRLLTDTAFVEEFDIVADEIAVDYVAGRFEGEEKERVEKYFLRAPERQNKVKVMCELLHQGSLARGEEVADRAARRAEPGLLERARMFWTNQRLAVRLASTVAALVILVGAVFLLRPGRESNLTYATLNLTISDAERASDGTEVKSVKLPSGTDELRIQLTLPSQLIPAKSYRAQLYAPPAPERDLIITRKDTQSVEVVIPAAELKPDRYAIRLFAINADGSEERVRGSYSFRVE
jgi:hypothetical protein